MIGKLLHIIGASLLCGLLGALGGAPVRHGKGYRRFGVPCVITLVALYNLHNPLVLILLLLIGVFCIGYGILNLSILPDIDAGDKGSILGRFWYNIFNRSEFWANVFTRVTIGLLICLIISIIPIIRGDWFWLKYIISSICIICFYSFISWLDLGSIKIKGITLAKCELYTYAYIAFVILSLTL